MAKTTSIKNNCLCSAIKTTKVLHIQCSQSGEKINNLRDEKKLTHFIKENHQMNMVMAVVFLVTKKHSIFLVFDFVSVTAHTGFHMQHHNCPMFSFGSHHPDLTRKDMYSTLIRFGTLTQLGKSIVEVYVISSC